MPNSVSCGFLYDGTRTITDALVTVGNGTVSSVESRTGSSADPTWAVGLPGLVDVFAHLGGYADRPGLLGFVHVDNAVAIAREAGIAAVKTVGLSLEAARYLRTCQPPGMHVEFEPRIATERPRTDGQLIAQHPSDVARTVELAASEGASWVALGPDAPPRHVGAAVKNAEALGCRVSLQPGRTRPSTAIDLGVSALLGFPPLAVEWPDTAEPQGIAKTVAAWSHAGTPEQRSRLWERLQESETVVIPLLTKWHNFLAPDRALKSPDIAMLIDVLPYHSWLQGGATGIGSRYAARSLMQHGFIEKTTRVESRNATTGWEAMLCSLSEARDHGVTFRIGSDGADFCVAPGWGIHREFRHMLAASFTAEELLRIVSAQNASFIGSSAAGRVSPGAVSRMLALPHDSRSQAGSSPPDQLIEAPINYKLRPTAGEHEGSGAQCVKISRVREGR